MVNKTVDTTFASKLIKSSKWLLLACATCSAAVDLLIIVLLAMGAMPSEYFICPSIMFAFDVIYLAVSAFFTNFRFKYSLKIWIGYIILSVIGMAMGSSILLGGSGTVITNAAFGVWAGVHAFGIVCAVVCALYASRVLKKGWAALTVAAVLVAGSVFYGAYMFTEGFFGQGYGVKPLVYSYLDESDSYMVIDVMAGNADKVEVPYTFNNKPVTAVSCRIFAATNVKEYVVHADQKLTDLATIPVNESLGEKVIYADKECAARMRSDFYEYAYTQTGGAFARKNALALANATLPVGLDEGEGYVAFNYDETAFAAVDGKTIPMYLGDLSAFDMNSYLSDYAYLNHRDIENTDDLHWSYYNNDGYIIRDVISGNASLFDATVVQNTVAEVNAERIYKVEVASGNDTKYDLRLKQPEFCFTTYSGGTLSYRYVTDGTAENFLSQLTPRKGFTCRWKTVRSQKEDLTSLGEYLREFGQAVIEPEWSLNAPTLTVSSDKPNNTITYGENLTLTAAAEIEAEGVTLNYVWAAEVDASVATRYTPVFELVRFTPSASGNYLVNVYVDGGEVTSLTSQAHGLIRVTINKKLVDFSWNIPSNVTYDGEEHFASVGFNEEQLVKEIFENPYNNDEINYTLSVGGNPSSQSGYTAGFTNAGTYSLSVVVADGKEFNKKYVCNNTVQPFTINKRPVEVEWSYPATVIYDGQEHCPEATAVGVAGDGNVVGKVGGGSKNAGTHTAYAQFGNNNYILQNVNFEYVIEPLDVQISWTDDELEYNGSVRQVAANVINKALTSDDVTVIVDGGGRNAGPYEMRATGLRGKDSGNYRLIESAHAPHPFTVTKKNLIITPKPVIMTYGNAQRGNGIICDGFVAGDGESVLKGTLSYSFAATKPTNGALANGLTVGGVTADNYEITFAPAALTIEKRLLGVVWQGYTGLTYDGTQKTVTASFINGVSGDEGLLVPQLSDNVQTNAGDYTATATLADGASDYYTISGGRFSRTYTIAKAAMTIIADDKSSVYGENIKPLTATVTCAVPQSVYEREISYSVICDGIENAGSYTVTVALTKTSDNYDVTLQNGTYTVSKAEYNFNMGLRGGDKVAVNGNTYTIEAVEGDYIEWSTDAAVCLLTESGLEVGWGNSFPVLSGRQQMTVKFEMAASDNYNARTVTVIITVEPAQSEVE